MVEDDQPRWCGKKTKAERYRLLAVLWRTGASAKVVAAYLGISVAWVHTMLSQARDEGVSIPLRRPRDVTPRPANGWRRALDEARAEAEV